MRFWVLLVLASEVTWLAALLASSLKIAGLYVGQDVEVGAIWQSFAVVFSCTLSYTLVYFRMQEKRAFAT